MAPDGAALLRGRAATPRPRTRSAAIARFRAKRERRVFGKVVRYESRKRLAASRPRVRGQFVKASAMPAYLASLAAAAKAKEEGKAATTTEEEEEEEEAESPSSTTTTTFGGSGGAAAGTAAAAAAAAADAPSLFAGSSSESEEDEFATLAVVKAFVGAAVAKAAVAAA